MHLSFSGCLFLINQRFLYEKVMKMLVLFSLKMGHDREGKVRTLTDSCLKKNKGKFSETE